MKIINHVIAAIALSVLISSNVAAENMKKLGDMNVHYMAIGSTFLTPAIAKTYGIERSKYNGLINIAVMNNTQEGNPAIKAAISGTAKNLLGQDKELTFVEVVEGEAIYYLAQVSYRNDETIRFSLTIDNGKQKQKLKFKQKFYAE